MKTITFYSYKGGVGRTLALANTAKRLSEFKKKVCLLDFDLEAPGLHLKFPQLNKEEHIGIVDYIYNYVISKSIPTSIKLHSTTIDFKNKYHTPIDIITAGKVSNKEYWKKLSSIHWNEFFYENQSQGIHFFIDLKEKIKRELNPDYLLIDSRTGISEISGISLSLFADEVVIISANNEENLGGAKLILDSIAIPENNLLGKTPKIHFVLSRIPYPQNDGEKISEANLRLAVSNNLLLDRFDIKDEQIIIIHSDRELELKESLKIGYETDKKSTPIAADYLDLFKRLINLDLSKNEIEQFNRIREAEDLYEQAEKARDKSEKVNLLTKAIELNPINAKLYFKLGETYVDLDNLHMAIQNINKSIEIDSSQSNAYSLLGICYTLRKNYTEALLQYSKAINISPVASDYSGRSSCYGHLGDLNNAITDFDNAIKLSPLSSKNFNSLADSYRINNKYDLALQYAKKAIELNPKSGEAYATLAEIKAALGEKEEFYFFTNIALSRDKELPKYFVRDNIYKQFFEEEKFQKLLERYNVKLKDILEQYKKQLE